MTHYFTFKEILYQTEHGSEGGCACWEEFDKENVILTFPFFGEFDLSLNPSHVLLPL
jgi:hypothetical protein